MDVLEVRGQAAGADASEAGARVTDQDRELSALRRRMQAYQKVGNDRSYIGVALVAAVIEG